jgi:hypothetical protein
MRRAGEIGLALLVATGCAASPPRPSEPSAPPPPLERACGETFALEERTVGALVRLLRRNNQALPVEARPCHAGTEWPIAFATGAKEGAPIGFVVLRMEGDALLTFDARDRETPTVNLCKELSIAVDAATRVRAVALWESSDETAFDAEHLEASPATLAWAELLSRTPSACAVSGREPPEATVAAEPPSVAPDAAAVEHSAAGTHRYTGEGRKAPPSLPALALRLERPELCLYEPPPAERDLCLAEYLAATGERWYGRGDVTRTGTSGAKNYVDSYLTFQILRRIEAERKRARPVGGGADPAKN